MFAGPGEDHRLDRAVGVHGLANRRHLLVHRKGQRVARLRAIEGQVGNAVLGRTDQVFSGCYRGVHRTLFLLLELRSAAEAAKPKRA